MHPTLARRRPPVPLRSFPSGDVTVVITAGTLPFDGSGGFLQAGVDLPSAPLPARAPAAVDVRSEAPRRSPAGYPRHDRALKQNQVQRRARKVREVPFFVQVMPQVRDPTVAHDRVSDRHRVCVAPPRYGRGDQNRRLGRRLGTDLLGYATDRPHHGAFCNWEGGGRRRGFRSCRESAGWPSGRAPGALF